VIIPDVNLILYAVFDGYPQHESAALWLNRSLSGTELFGLTSPSIFGFLRLATSARVHENPLSVRQAGDYLQEWLARPQTRFLTPGPDHVERVLGLLAEVGTGANLTTDAQIAAFAMEHDATVHSNDADFGRFPEIRWLNPLTR
jgi:toxin-antitoxin system PIN domain toxin